MLMQIFATLRRCSTWLLIALMNTYRINIFSIKSSHSYHNNEMRSIIVLCSVLAVASGFTAPVSITNTVDAAPSIVSAPHQQLLNDGINAWSASLYTSALSSVRSPIVPSRCAITPVCADCA